MDYIKEIDKNNVGLKTTLKKILKDVDKRIENGGGESGDCTELQSQVEQLQKNSISPNKIPLISLDLTQCSYGILKGGVSGGNTLRAAGFYFIISPQYSSANDIIRSSDESILDLLEVTEIKVGDNTQEVTRIESYTQNNCIALDIDCTIQEAYDEPVPISVTIKNKRNNELYTTTGTVTYNSNNNTTSITTTSPTSGGGGSN